MPNAASVSIGDISSHPQGRTGWACTRQEARRIYAIEFGGAPDCGKRRRANSGEPLHTSVDVVQPHDVILPEIAADLHLNQFEANFAGIGKPVNASDRDIY
jgi:hypothetical protein